MDELTNKIITGGALVFSGLVSWVFKRELRQIDSKLKAHDLLIGQLLQEVAILKQRDEDHRIYIKEKLDTISEQQKDVKAKLDSVIQSLAR